MLTLLFLAAGGYLLGSFPTSLVVGKTLRGIDIREHGSGNAGASNILRTVGASAAVFVLAVDVAKGFAAAELGRRIRLDALPVDDEWAPLVASLAAIFGHLWPVFAGFRGGKGVATAAGVILALDPRLLIIAVLVFAAVLLTSRRIALGSIVAAISLPVSLFVMRAVWEIPVAASWSGFNLLLALLIAHTHRSNISRLFAGGEPTI